MEKQERRTLPGLPVGDGTSLDLNVCQFKTAHPDRPNTADRRRRILPCAVRGIRSLDA